MDNLTLQSGKLKCGLDRSVTILRCDEKEIRAEFFQLQLCQNAGN